ncbi:hypothetical protein MASR2M15_21990 [Anaerolineales bacterium]
MSQDQYPKQLKETLEDFSLIANRLERQEYLISLADQFDGVKVPETIASQPYDEDHRVKACESDAYVWAVEQEDGTLAYYFDVLNPQGLSAMAVGVILGEACSGAPLESVAAIDNELIFELFGKNISMGKGQGLMGMVDMVTFEAKKRLNP